MEEYNRPFSLEELIILLEEFEDTKGVIRIRISKKNRQHNDQKKTYKRTNNDETGYCSMASFSSLKHLSFLIRRSTILVLINDIWETGDFSSFWILANVIPILKTLT